METAIAIFQSWFQLIFQQKIKNMVVSCPWPAVVGVVDATFGKQALSHDRCNIFSRFSYNKANNAFLNSLRKN